MLILIPQFALALDCSILFKKNLPSPKKNLPPLIKQSTHFTCGPTALLSWLKSRGDNTSTEKSLAKVLSTNFQFGTPYNHFVNGIESLGYAATFTENLSVETLRELLSQGYGIIVSMQLSGSGHWALLVDISPAGQSLTFMDPWLAKTGYHSISRTHFEKNWYDFFGTERLKTNRAAIIIAP